MFKEVINNNVKIVNKHIEIAEASEFSIDQGQFTLNHNQTLSYKNIYGRTQDDGSEDHKAIFQLCNLGNNRTSEIRCDGLIDSIVSLNSQQAVFIMKCSNKIHILTATESTLQLEKITRPARLTSMQLLSENQIAVGTGDGSIELWNFESNEFSTHKVADEPIKKMSLLPNNLLGYTYTKVISARTCDDSDEYITTCNALELGPKKTNTLKPEVQAKDVKNQPSKVPQRSGFFPSFDNGDRKGDVSQSSSGRSQIQKTELPSKIEEKNSNKEIFLKRCSASMKDYLKNLENKKDFATTMREMQISIDEGELLTAFRDPESKKIMKHPVSLNERVYDLETVIGFNGVDPVSGYEFHALEVTPSKNTIAAFEEVIKNIQMDRNKNALPSSLRF